MKKLLFIIVLFIYFIPSIRAEEYVDISGNITWDDNNNKSNKRPDSITIDLYANGEKIDSKIVYGSKEADNYTRYFEDRYTIKGMEDVLDTTYNYDYLAFSSGINFNNKELYAARAAMQHTTPTNRDEWGKIVFFERTQNGVRTIYPDIDYSKYNAELRDPNLSPGKDDNHFFLSVFTTDSDNDHKSIIMYMDKDYNVVSDYVEDSKLFWGNTLLTPTNHLLKTAYYGQKVYLFISNEIFEGDLSDMTYNQIQIESSSILAEPTIGYYNDKLVIITRVTNDNSELFYTNDLEGVTGWSSPIKLDYQIHSPVLLSSYNGNKLLFSGSLLKSGTLRVPVIGYVEVPSGKITNLKEVDPLIDHYSGYPALVKHNSGYGMIYYQNKAGNQKSAMFLLDISDSYDTENLYSYNWAWTFANKPEYDEGNNKINYSIKYNDIDDYIVTDNGYNLVAKLKESDNNDSYKIIDDDNYKKITDVNEESNNAELSKDENANSFIKNNSIESPNTGYCISIMIIFVGCILGIVLYNISKKKNIFKI